MAKITLESHMLVNSDYDVELWLPISIAQDVARKLIDENEIFEYCPESDEEVHIVAGAVELDKVLEIEIKVK